MSFGNEKADFSISVLVEEYNIQKIKSKYTLSIMNVKLKLDYNVICV